MLYTKQPIYYSYRYNLEQVIEFFFSFELLDKEVYDNTILSPTCKSNGDKYSYLLTM